MGSRTHPQGNTPKGSYTKFEHIFENAPPMFSATQLRMFLQTLVNLDPYALLPTM